MDPFFVLGVTCDTTDAEVEAHYRALLAQMPPDSAGERFATLRAAYEALRTPRGRVDAALFHFDESGTALTHVDDWLTAGARRPPALEALRALAQELL